MLTIRPAVDDDLAFVLDSWLESFCESHAAGPISMPLYREVYPRVLRGILARDGVEVWVAEHAGEGVLIGWLVLERGVFEKRTSRILDVIHYVFVRQAFRRWKPVGVASQLFESAYIEQPFIYTFKTPMGVDVIRHRHLMADWNPMVVRVPKSKPQETQDAPRHRRASRRA